MRREARRTPGVGRELRAYPDANGASASIEPAPVKLVYRQAGFIAMHGPSMKAHATCSEADREEVNRFVVTPRSCR